MRSLPMPTTPKSSRPGLSLTGAKTRGFKTMLHIAWINTAPDSTDGNTADVTIWDAIEHRIEVFHADTGIPVTGDRGDIIERATEVLQDDGWIVHSVEPHVGHGYA